VVRVTACPRLKINATDRESVTCSFKIRKNSRISAKFKNSLKFVLKNSLNGRGLPVQYISLGYL